LPVDYSRAGVAPAVSGMNVAKIRRARRILARNFVDLDQSLYMALTSQQIEDLTGDAKATNTDFLNAVKPKWSEDGKYLIGLAGFEFIEIELGNPLFDNAGLTLDRRQRRSQVPVLVGRRHGDCRVGGAVYVGRQAPDAALQRAGLFARTQLVRRAPIKIGAATFSATNSSQGRG
jgi:hypothetical protein